METKEERESRLKKRREYDKQKRNNETQQERESRLAQQRKYDKQKRDNETQEKKESRLAQQRAYGKWKRDNETQEEKELRLKKRREHDKQKRDNETQEEREAKLEQQPQVNQWQFPEDLKDKDLEKMKETSDNSLSLVSNNSKELHSFSLSSSSTGTYQATLDHHQANSSAQSSRLDIRWQGEGNEITLLKTPDQREARLEQQPQVNQEQFLEELKVINQEDLMDIDLDDDMRKTRNTLMSFLNNTLTEPDFSSLPSTSAGTYQATLDDHCQADSSRLDVRWQGEGNEITLLETPEQREARLQQQQHVSQWQLPPLEQPHDETDEELAARSTDQTFLYYDQGQDIHANFAPKASSSSRLQEGSNQDKDTQESMTKNLEQQPTYNYY